MPNRPSRAWRGRAIRGILVAILCGAFVAQGFFASRQKSPTNDEPVHIASGAFYVATHAIVANPQHPPLMKEMSGLSLRWFGIRMNPFFIPRGEWFAAMPFLIDNGVAHVLVRARLPLLLASALLGLLIYWWGRDVAGTRAGLAALFLFAFDPTMLGHSYLVTTDMGVATFSLLFLLTLQRYMRQPGIGRLGIAGVTLGLGLCAKFSGIFLLPIAAILLVAGGLWPERSSGDPSPETRTRGLLGSAVAALGALAGLLVIAMVVIQILYLSPRGPLLYLHGLSSVNADHDPSALRYLAGRLKPRFVSYFLVLWLLKEPLAAIALAIAGTVIIIRRKAIPRLTKLFLAIPPAIFVLACILWADDLGVRYVIPAMPFAYLAGGIALASLWNGGAIQRTAAVAACGWVAIAAAGIYPDHLSYLNEAACLPSHLNRIGWDGGSRCGPDWLSDSNVDWGQSLPQLKTWLNLHDPRQTTRVLYFGSFPPSAYGIRAPEPKETISLAPPGLVAISASILGPLRAKGKIDWLRKEPVAVVGHAYYIYDLGPK